MCRDVIHLRNRAPPHQKNTSAKACDVLCRDFRRSSPKSDLTSGQETERADVTELGDWDGSSNALGRCEIVFQLQCLHKGTTTVDRISVQQKDVCPGCHVKKKRSGRMCAPTNGQRLIARI